MISRILIISIFLLLSLTGCGKRPVISEQSFNRNIDWSRETAASIKERITVAARQLDIITAFFQINMNPPPKKMLS